MQGAEKTQDQDPPVVDPEWVDNDPHNPPPPPPGVGGRLERAVGPVAGGLIIDGLDLMTFGPLGFMFGALIGGSVAYYIGGIERLPVWQRVCLAIVAGLYCAMPRTNFIPAATLIGTLIRFWKND